MDTLGLIRTAFVIKVWVRIADAATILAKGRRCLHDHLAGTKAVKLRRPFFARLITGIMFESITSLPTMSIEPENPYATPVNDPIPETNPILGAQLATLSERFLGAFIDGLVGLGVAAVIWGGLFAAGTIHAFVDIGRLGLVYSIAIGLVGFAAFVAINWKFLNATGQTIGKKVAKTRIVTLAGEKPQINDLLLKRYAFFQLVPLIPFVGSIFSLVNILFIFRKDRRCLHDLVANTQVIKATV